MDKARSTPAPNPVEWTHERGDNRAARLFAVLIRITAVAVPVLYVMGRVYAEGYWSSQGLSSSLLSFDVDDYLYLGFVAVVIGSTAMLDITGHSTGLYVLVGGVALTILTTLVAAVDHWVTTSVRGRLKVIDERTARWRGMHGGWLSRIGYPAAAIGIGFYSLFIVFFTLLLVVLLLLVLFQKAGAASATHDSERYAAYAAGKITGTSIGRVRYHQSNGQVRHGLLLQCSDQWCFVYEAGTFAAISKSDISAIGIYRK